MKNAKTETDLPVAALRELSEKLMQATEGFPRSPLDQLKLAIRKLGDPAHAVIVQRHLFPTLSGTCASRNPLTGESKLTGKFCPRVKPVEQQISALDAALTEKLRAVLGKIEKSAREVVSVDFVAEAGEIYVFRWKQLDHAIRASLKLNVEFAQDGILTKEEAIQRMDFDHLAKALTPCFALDAIAAVANKRIARADPIGFIGGAKATFVGPKPGFIFVTPSFNVDALPAEGELPVAVVAKQVVGENPSPVPVLLTPDLQIDAERKVIVVEKKVVCKENEPLSIDGEAGDLYAADLQVVEQTVETNADLKQLIAFADEIRSLKLYGAGCEANGHVGLDGFLIELDRFIGDGERSLLQSVLLNDDENAQTALESSISDALTKLLAGLGEGELVVKLLDAAARAAIPSAFDLLNELIDLKREAALAAKAAAEAEAARLAEAEARRVEAEAAEAAAALAKEAGEEEVDAPPPPTEPVPAQASGAKVPPQKSGAKVAAQGSGAKVGRGQKGSPQANAAGVDAQPSDSKIEPQVDGTKLGEAEEVPTEPVVVETPEEKIAKRRVAIEALKGLWTTAPGSDLRGSALAVRIPRLLKLQAKILSTVLSSKRATVLLPYVRGPTEYAALKSGLKGLPVTAGISLPVCAWSAADFDGGVYHSTELAFWANGKPTPEDQSGGDFIPFGVNKAKAKKPWIAGVEGNPQDADAIDVYHRMGVDWIFIDGATVIASKIAAAKSAIREPRRPLAPVQEEVKGVDPVPGPATAAAAQSVEDSSYTDTASAA